MSGHAICSPSIARTVKKAGGDAVIIQSEEEAGKTGGYGSASPYFGFLMSGGSKTITVMLVVKYLPDGERAVNGLNSFDGESDSG